MNLKDEPLRVVKSPESELRELKLATIARFVDSAILSMANHGGSMGGRWEAERILKALDAIDAKGAGNVSQG
jgi:hypothetical protein